MHIYLNGERHEVSTNITAAQLIEELGLADRRLAMEINQEIVPRSQHATHTLNAQDRVEIVHAIGGG